jgi:hypothetical protein
MNAGAGANTGATGFYSVTNRPGIVPVGATEVGRTAATGGATIVTYTSGGLYYNVTYYPTGRYTYTISGSPMVSGASTGAVGATGSTMGTSGTTGSSAGGAGTSTGTSMGGSSFTGGTTALPQTGGGDPTSPLPAIPALLGLGLAAVGLTVRKMARR